MSGSLAVGSEPLASPQCRPPGANLKGKCTGRSLQVAAAGEERARPLADDATIGAADLLRVAKRVASNITSNKTRKPVLKR